MKQYRCIKGFSVDMYDEDDLLIENSQMIIEVGEIYKLDESGNKVLAGEVHLDNTEDATWIEVPREYLKEYFMEV